MQRERRHENLIRILRSETADHPLIEDAVLAKIHLVDAFPWDVSLARRGPAEGFANALEDYCAYRGHALDYYVCEPWLSRWRETCWRAMLKAHAEIVRDALPSG
jgi:hypothetical protein